MFGVFCRQRYIVGGGGSVCATTMGFGKCFGLPEKLLRVTQNGIQERMSMISRAASVV